MGKFYQELADELSVHTQFSAWLNAVPERAPGSKAEQSKAPPKSRLQAFRAERKDEHWTPDMPPVDDAGAYLLAYLWEVGPTLAGGMGPAPLTQCELQAWQANTGIELHAWESRLLRRLSCNYLDAASKAEKFDCPAPWRPVEVGVDRSAVANNMLNAIRALTKG